MIRKLMASSAMLALLTGGALTGAQAQTTPATEAPAATAPVTAAPAGDAAAATTDMAPGTADATLTPDQPTIATAYIGRSVFSSEDPESDNIGNVNDLIIGDEGMITHAVVGVGGFLGIGEKNVAVPFDELQVVEDSGGEIRLIYSATREQLEAAEAFDRTAFDPRQRAAETAENAADAPAGGVTTAPTDTAATPPAATGETAAAPMAGETATTAPASVDMTAAPATGETAAPATGDMAAAPAVGETAAAPATDMPAGSFVNYSADQMRASTMIGKSVFGPGDETIGEVSDLVLDADGKTRSALIDVGGFLGIGEKRVAVPFADIKPAAPDVGASADAEPKLTVAMTKEQLEQAPAYVDPNAAAAASTGTAATGTMATDAPATETSATTGTETAMAPDAAAPAGGALAPAAGTDPQMSADMAYAPVTQELTADNLIGSAVYGSSDENLGEVGDVVFDAQGVIQAVVVDVGGFLGVGEKPVAVQFDALQVQRNAAGDFRLKVNANQEALQNAPTYETAASTGGQAAPAVQ